MTVLVVGASGATGRLLVRQFLARGEDVRAVVRSVASLPDDLRQHDRLAVTEASLLDLTDQQMVDLVSGCEAVASCLGHNLSWKGLFGPPRRLVTDATRRVCDAIRQSGLTTPTKFVLMNTTGNSNRDLIEPISMGQKIVIGLLRLLLPPHVDNDHAADYLRTQVGQGDSAIEWVAVRPDGLIDEDSVSECEVHPSPTRSAIFNAGKTSRINVGHFMADLVTDDDTWKRWQGQMPVIYNKEMKNRDLLT
jgi:nucleoside-diphosphate-sugar epimerase